jgi:hypothetical protein
MGNFIAVNPLDNMIEKITTSPVRAMVTFEGENPIFWLITVDQKGDPAQMGAVDAILFTFKNKQGRDVISPLEKTGWNGEFQIRPFTIDGEPAADGDGLMKAIVEDGLISIEGMGNATVRGGNCKFMKIKEDTPKGGAKSSDEDAV